MNGEFVIHVCAVYMYSHTHVHVYITECMPSVCVLVQALMRRPSLACWPTAPMLSGKTSKLSSRHSMARLSLVDYDVPKSWVATLLCLVWSLSLLLPRPFDPSRTLWRNWRVRSVATLRMSYWLWWWRQRSTMHMNSEMPWRYVQMHTWFGLKRSFLITLVLID